MAKRIALVLAIVLAILVIGGLAFDHHYRIERSIVIAAQPATIYPHVATLESWPEWTVWTREADPNSKFEFSGARTGAGAVMRWTGAKDGELRILTADPSTGLTYEIVGGDAGSSIAGEILLEREVGGTRVTWVNSGALGRRPFGGWVMLLAGPTFEDALGQDLQTGLERLKVRAETSDASCAAPAR